MGEMAAFSDKVSLMHLVAESKEGNEMNAQDHVKGHRCQGEEGTLNGPNRKNLSHAIDSDRN